MNYLKEKDALIKGKGFSSNSFSKDPRNPVILFVHRTSYDYKLFKI